MNKKTLSLIGMLVGFVFVLVGILALCGILGGDASYPSGASYSYDSGYATFGADYYTYSVNNAAETASAAKTTAGNLVDIATFLKNFCGLFSICFGAVIICCFGIYRAGLKESEIKIANEAVLLEVAETVAEEAAEVSVEEAAEVSVEEAAEVSIEEAAEIDVEEAVEVVVEEIPEASAEEKSEDDEVQ